MATKIEAASLLLQRIGSLDSDYYLYLDAYSANEQGKPITPTVSNGTAIQIASNINNKQYYNFVFNPAIQIDSDYVVFILRQDSDAPEDSHIVWVHSDISSDVFQYGYSFSSGAQQSDSNFTGYINLYSYTVAASTDFFTVFSLGYDNDYSRCIKVYKEFNKIEQTTQGYEIEIAGHETSSVSISNPAVADKYKSNSVEC